MEKKRKNRIKEPNAQSKVKPFRVQLDNKTFMMMSQMSSLQAWLTKYPNAKVVPS